jgi:hypothetical protein
LALLDHLGRRALSADGQELPLNSTEIVALLERVRGDLPRWAAAYDDRLSALAQAAVNELVTAGLLREPDPVDLENDAGERRWLPTPAVRMWRVKLRVAPAREAAGVHQVDAGHSFEPPPQLFEC